MKHIVQQIHFVGIGGAGMSGIAEVLLNLGYQVNAQNIHVVIYLKRMEQKT
jgi:UDP-N-acetylmuramate--alanine ligase